MKNIEMRGIRARKNFFLQKSSLMMNEKQRLTGHRDMKRNIFLLLFPLFSLSVLPQIRLHNPVFCWYADLWAGPEGIIDSIYYDPPIPQIWLGDVSVRDGIFGSENKDLHLKEGIMRQYEIGITLFQVSKNLYRGIAGISTSLQFVAHVINLDRHYMPHRSGDDIAFEPAVEPLRSSNIYYQMIRIPVLAGIQTSNRLFSIQTGPSFEIRMWGGRHEYRDAEGKTDRPRIHVPPLGINWHVMANAGPFTFTYTQSLLPAFQLSGGIEAYTRSFTVGYNFCFFRSYRYKKAFIKQRETERRMTRDE